MMIKEQVKSMLSTPWGLATIRAYAAQEDEKMPHIVLEFTSDNKVNPLVRIHSECLTGDIFGSRRCDCGDQLHQSLDQIAENGGVLIYLRQEGRNIGLINKLKAYNLQDSGANTVEANHQLGLTSDARSYEDAAIILKDMGITKVRILTNNPEKVSGLTDNGIEVFERVGIEIKPHRENARYLQTKKDLMGHILDINK